MYVRYGAYTSALSEAGVAFLRESITAPATGLQIGIKERWDITGFLQAANTTALTAAMTALELAFSLNYMPIQLIANDGVTVLRTMLPITPIGGVRVTSPVSYPDPGLTNAEGSTYRTYRVTVEGFYVLPAAGTLPFITLIWHETITQHGTGGGRFVFRQPLNGLPRKQQTADATTVRVVQRGQAVGYFGYPSIPDPIWSEAEHVDQREIEKGTPQRSGSTYLEFPVSWTYVFEDIAPGQVFQPNPFSGN